MIQTKVARIISPTQVILTAGAKDGVTEGMEFVIYELTDPILDPETKESLGRLELVKGRVRVVHTQQTMSIAQTIPQIVTRPSPLDSLRPNYFAIALSGYSETVFPKLPVKEDEITPLPTEPKVRVGDLAHSVETAETRLRLSS